MTKRSPFRYFKTIPRDQPETIVTDKLRSYAAALKEVGAGARQETGRWLNNRAENSHLPFRRREWAMLRFRRMRSLQKFASVHASVSNHFNQDSSLSSRLHFKLTEPPLSTNGAVFALDKRQLHCPG